VLSYKKMDIQQMFELLRKESRAEKRADDRFKAWREKMAAETEATQAETEAIKARSAAMREKMGTSHMEMVSEFKPEIEEETMASQEMEERLEKEEPTSVDRKPEVAQHRKVPVEDAVLKQVNGRKKRQRSKKQAAGRREEPKKLTRGDCGSRMKLAAACRKVSRHTTVTRRRRDAFKNERTQDGCQRRLAATVRKWYGK
jgi:DNA polymerase III gamma/tau subunit